MDGRPTRVVVFGGGPVPEYGAREFICRLDEHPDIALVGVFCQSKAQTFAEVVLDTVRRRGALAVPLLLVQGAGAAARLVAHPARTRALQRRWQRVSDRLWFMPDIHAKEVIDQVGRRSPDIGLIYGAPILRPCLFQIPKLGTLGIHHGRLPDYRGKKTTFWAMYRGEPQAFVTIQKVTAGLDQGDVVKEGQVTIGRLSYGEVWRRLEAVGLDLYMEAICELAKDPDRLTEKRAPGGKLYRDPSLRDLINFYWRHLKRRLSFNAHT
jgi:methionyl-tRNA formyltransferase